jgi:predicted Zn-dependent peptidase
MELKEGVESSEVEEVIYSEIERIGRAEISPEELERARVRSLVQFIGDLETTFDQAFQLGITEVMNQPGKIGDYSNLIRSVTIEAVSAMVRSAMNRRNSTIAILERKDF